MLFWRSSAAIPCSKSPTITAATSSRSATSERISFVMAPKLILTGFMATGKTAVARAIARRPGWQLIDCDERIVARAGKSIPEIFRTEGEARFREIKREVISEIAREDPDTSQRGESPSIVVAPGGGA